MRAVRASMQLMACVPLTLPRAAPLAPYRPVRALRASPMLCADRTVVESCSDKIRAALSPEVS